MTTGTPQNPPTHMVDDSFQLGSHRLGSRLIVGTGKYANYEQMQEALALSGTECITVAVRRERLVDKEGRNILDFIDLDRYILLPNTAGCFNAEDAIRTARLGREILLGLENPGADWVKLEVLGDSRTLLPDPMATLAATQQLVAEGFQVLCYTSDDPVAARRLKEAGATSVMPAGSPIGSGQGILNANNLRICLEYLKENDPHYPGDCGCGGGDGERRDGGHGVGSGCGVVEHGDCPRSRSTDDGLGDEGGSGSRSLGIPVGTDTQASLCHGQQSHGRRHRVAVALMLTPADILGPEGRIAARLEHYESRPQQVEMAEAVAAALADRQHLVVEAGTGVGKSFAYLVPAILAATAERDAASAEREDDASPYRVVVSTHTISLQEQLLTKDLPLLNAVIPREFSAVLVKGRGNYVSLRRLELAHKRAGSLFAHDEEHQQLRQLREWAARRTMDP